MAYNIDLNKDLIKQVEKINCKIQDIEITINKLGSFYPLIEMLENKFKNKTNTVTIICYPYESKNKFSISNHHKYCFVLSENYIDIYVDDVRIITDGENIEIPNNDTHLIDNYFILDLFKIYHHVMTYKWNSECEFHKGTDSAWYGEPEGEYIRHGHIIEIRTFNCCCNYIGGVSFYDLEKNEYDYSSCGCFEDKNYLDNSNNECNNNSNNECDDNC